MRTPSEQGADQRLGRMLDHSLDQRSGHHAPESTRLKPVEGREPDAAGFRAVFLNIT